MNVETYTHPVLGPVVFLTSTNFQARVMTDEGVVHLLDKGDAAALVRSGLASERHRRHVEYWFMCRATPNFEHNIEIESDDTTRYCGLCGGLFTPQGRSCACGGRVPWE